jgi:hypothetical protein
VEKVPISVWWLWKLSLSLEQAEEADRRCSALHNWWRPMTMTWYSKADHEADWCVVIAC